MCVHGLGTREEIGLCCECKFIIIKKYECKREGQNQLDDSCHVWFLKKKNSLGYVK